ncbi:MAG: M20 family metallopeptidase [Anaerolineae bacterium]|nr:M20 family metallopeptidase [Anaerolineae bacterium]
MTIDFRAIAEAMREELVARRRDFHQHPETAFEEVRTAGIVAKELQQLGLEVQTGVGKTGVIGILDGDKEGPTVLVRADMDALPVTEANETDYVSQTAGKMHACGHDGHTAVALGVAKLFSQHRDKLKGRIKFVFQPAEEIGAGAKAMIADGALQNPKPDVSLGLHLWNSVPLGKVGIADGPIMAAPSIFEITIHGKGGHGAMPDETIDPLVCAAQMVMAFQTIASRNASPFDQLALSVTQIITGTAKNIIPDSAYLSGTFRWFTPQIRDMVDKRMREIAEHTAAAMGCTADIQIAHQANPVVNHPEVSGIVRGAFKKIGIDEADMLHERTTAAEDVGEFMTDIPGMFFFVGSANEERGLNYPHHHPRFDFDEDALPLSVALLSAAIAEYVVEDE